MRDIAKTTGLAIVLGVALPINSRSEQINFIGTVSQALSYTNNTAADGAPVRGTITYDSLTLIYLSGDLAVYTNANARVTIYINGIAANYWGIQAYVSTLNFDPGMDLNSDRLKICFGTNLTPGIDIYSYQYLQAWAALDDPSWWEHRIDSPIDHTVTIGSNVAVLSDYGEAPSLTLAGSPGSAVISYPTNVPGYILESSSFLGTNAVWQPVTNPPALNGHFYNTIVTNPSESSFFRLGTTN